MTPATFFRFRREFKTRSNPAQAEILAGFFKTGPGGYAQGDRFWGVMVPQTRQIVQKYAADITLGEIKKILEKGWHEERLGALLMLVAKFKKGSAEEKKKIFAFYLAHMRHVNNWDLVDLSAPQIAGGYLRGKSKAILQKLARSPNLWERRIAIVSTFEDIRQGHSEPAFRISQILLKDKHDLIHKATGWMLRECGKKCGEKKLEEFLRQNIQNMSRTTLRYAIERFPETKRLKYLKM
jgi:3-methyladenine DNA glycosylase AlkD